MFQRIGRLARLDTSVFDEVRDDPRELVPALVIAGISCLLAGLGSWLWWELAWDAPTPDDLVVRTFILGSIFLAALYFVWIVIVYVVLAQFFKTSADLNSLIRTMGYAGVALAPSLLACLPVIYPLFFLLPIALLIIMTIYAVQACTSAEPNQVIIANLIGFSVFALLGGIIALSGDFGKAPIGAGVFSAFWDTP
jgi:hypothetical protein